MLKRILISLAVVFFITAAVGVIAYVAYKAEREGVDIGIKDYEVSEKKPQSSSAQKANVPQSSSLPPKSIFGSQLSDCPQQPSGWRTIATRGRMSRKE